MTPGRAGADSAAVHQVGHQRLPRALCRSVPPLLTLGTLVFLHTRKMILIIYENTNVQKKANLCVTPTVRFTASPNLKKKERAKLTRPVPCFSDVAFNLILSLTVPPLVGTCPLVEGKEGE